MSRFLTRFSGLPAFEEAGIGLAEWTALSTISGRDGLANQQLANLLGVSAQRANQICEALRRATLVNISVSPDDARKKVITITPAGSAQLKELNSKLQALIQGTLNARPRLLARADAILNRDIMGIVLPSAARKAVREPS
jgi:DNA-binding MarR family transcriptional regulator